MENGTEEPRAVCGACPADGEGTSPRRVADQDEARCASRRSARRSNLVIAVLAALLVASSLASLMLGRYPINPAEAVGMLAHLAVPFDPFWTSQQETLFFQVRLPRIVLAGVMVSSLFSAGVSYTKLVADPSDQLAAITYWLMGSLTGAKWGDMALAAAPIAVGLVALFALRWRINVLTMGDDEASTMGVNARRVRLLVILAATLVTAASVSISGMIGWVGLVIPHFSRMIIGCDYRKLLPASMLMGATFLLVVDDLARLMASSEIPIGILTAFVGAPFFLYLITRRKQQL